MRVVIVAEIGLISDIITHERRSRLRLDTSGQGMICGALLISI